MPVYNECPVLDDVVDELLRDIVAKLDDAELVAVDDCSTDGSGAVLDRRAEGEPKLRVEHAPANRGHGPSVRRAIDLADGDWLFQVDSDGQFVAAEFWDLWDRRDGADLVIGCRRVRRDPRHRRALTRAVRVAASALAGGRLVDPNAPFKLVRRDVWDDVAPVIAPDALAPSIMLAVGARARRWRVVEVPVTHLPRRSGPGSLRPRRLVRFSLRGLGQLLRFRLALRRLPPR